MSMKRGHTRYTVNHTQIELGGEMTLSLIAIIVWGLFASFGLFVFSLIIWEKRREILKWIIRRFR